MKKRILSLLLALVLIVGMLPTVALAAEQEESSDAKSVTVWFTCYNVEDYTFPVLRRQITVPVGTAAKYGLENAEKPTLVGGAEHGVDPTDITVLDAVVAAHEAVYGDQFTTETIDNYIGGSSSYLTKIFNQSTDTGIGFSVNDSVVVGEVSDGYAVNECVIKDNDEINFYLYTDDEMYGMFHEYTYFDQKTCSVEEGTPLTLTLRGFAPSETMLGKPGDPTTPVTIKNEAGVKIFVVENGAMSDFLYLADGETPVTTDENGQFTYTFSQAGTYYIGAFGDNEDSFVISPLCKITVTAPQQEKTLESIAVTKAPNKTEYLVGDTFNPAGMVVTATYSDGSTEDVTSDCTYAPTTIAADTTAITITYEGKTATQAITVSTPYDTITVPADATLFVGQKTKHFVPFTEIKPVSEKTDEAAGTKTYRFALTAKQQYNFRVSGEGYVTLAGIFTRDANNTYTRTVTEAELKPEGKSKTTIDRNLKSNNGYNVADVYLNINEKDYLSLDKTGDTYQLMAVRNWQTVDTVTNNYFIEPDYHYTVVDETGAASDVVSVDANGVITANKEGTAIVLVTYDAIQVESAVGGPFFGAIWPENTGVFVVSVGAQDSGIETGMTVNEGRYDTLIGEGKSKRAGDMIDAELDVIYFTGDTGSYSFTPVTAGCTVAVANPTVGETLRFTGFETVDAESDGSFEVPLVEGRNIVKLTKDGKSTYQVITAKKLSYTINSGEPVKPGDKVTIKFETVYHPVNKLSGIYNYNAIITYKTPDGKLAGGTSNQYQFASTEAAQTVAGIVEKKTSGYVTLYQKVADLTIPEDYTASTYTLTNGAVGLLGWGDAFGNHEGLTLEGKNPNLSAGSPAGFMAVLPDIVIPIDGNAPTLSGIAVTTAPTKTAYLAGESFDPAGMVVTATYSDGSTKQVDLKNCTITPDPLTADTTEVTITFNGQTATVTVQVTQPTITGIEISKRPDKTVYEAGEYFDPTGMVVKAVYSNGTKQEIFDYTYAPTRKLTTSDTRVTIRFEGKTATTTITVKEAETPETPSDTITVYFTLLGDKKHGESGTAHTLADGNLTTWISRRAIKVKKNAYVIDVLKTALAEAGISYQNPSGNYVTTIRGLGEFDNGSLSGWMYTYNDVHSNLGVAEQRVRDGDEIVFHYTDDYTRESGSEEWRDDADEKDRAAADEVEKLIRAIGKVTKNSKNDIARARRAYNALTYAQRNLVRNYRTLLDAEEEYEALTGQKAALPFVDVDGHWAEDDIRFVYENGLFSGTSSTRFSPDANMTRAMLVTVLYRLEGEPRVSGRSGFSDVQLNSYYEDAVTWAADNGIVNGTSDTTFSPNANVTREQMAAILYRYAQYKKYNTSASTNLYGFTDYAKVSSYAVKPLQWAVAERLVNGSSGKLMPTGYATRAQVAAILHRFVENVAD